jgi:hypothetical protein
MTTRIQLEPEAQSFAEAMAKPPFFFQPWSQEGRITLDELQPEQENKLQIDMEDLTNEDGSCHQVSIRILRPKHVKEDGVFFVCDMDHRDMSEANIALLLSHTQWIACVEEDWH